MTEDGLSRRYCVLTEGELAINNHLVLPGAARVLDPHSIIPVTTNYDNQYIIGAANGFARAGVIDGIAKITFNVRLKKDGNLTHDDLRKLKPGVFLAEVFAFQQPGEPYKWITDGVIKEISFYDPSPPKVKLS